MNEVLLYKYKHNEDELFHYPTCSAFNCEKLISEDCTGYACCNEYILQYNV